MKTLFLICVSSVAFALTGFSQTPSVAPATSPGGASPVTGASIATSPTATASGDLADKIHRRIDQKMKKKGMHFTIGGSDDDADEVTDRHSHDDIPAMVVPLVGVIFLTVFGTPILIVAVIMYFGFSRNRMMHRTVRMMVEKGQPVPAALLAPPPPAQRQRSDMRRGVVLLMVGVGLMIFFGAVNDWENGVWAIGVLPFLIGAGYLMVWKLEGGQKPKTDIPPPLP